MEVFSIFGYPHLPLATETAPFRKGSEIPREDPLLPEPEKNMDNKRPAPINGH